MAVTTEIITATEIIDLAVPNKTGFEVRFFANHILKNQIKYVRPFLGDDYYEDLRDKVAAGTLSSDDTALLDNYLKPMLAHYIMYERLPYIHNKIQNSGVMNDFNEFANSGSSRTLAMMRDQYYTDAQDFEKQADQYVIDAQDDDFSKFPLYKCGKQRGYHGFIIY